MKVRPEVQLLGRHHVLSVLSEDELGTVNLARLEGPSGFQRWVALRIVNRELARDPKFKEAFYSAARFGGQVSHANVANTLEVGETNGTLWMAQEYLHGEPLGDVMQRAREYEMPLPWDIACRIASDIALGVDALHEVRRPGGERLAIVHGRLAPHQIVVTYDGKTKVLGVPVGGAERAPGAREQPYMAPEIEAGAPPTTRSDIYAVGVLLWELVSGRALFAGTSDTDTRAKIRAHQVPALKPMSLGCPERVDKIVQRAIAVDEKKRFPTARELGQALQAALVSEALVVTDDDVGRYVLKLFGDTFEEREDRLRSASEVTEVFRRSSHPAPPGMDPDGTMPMVDMPPRTVRMPNIAHVPPTYAPMPVPIAPVDFGDLGETQIRPPQGTPPPPSVVVRATPTPPPTPPPQRSGSYTPTALTKKPRSSALPYVLVGGTALVVAITLAGVYRMRVRAPFATAASTSSPTPTSTPTPTTDPTPKPSIRPPRPPKPPPPPSGATGLLTIICVPACDQVFVGGRALGPSPVLKVPVAAGSHRIRMKVNDPPTEKVVVVDVGEDDTKVVRQSME